MESINSLLSNVQGYQGFLAKQTGLENTDFAATHSANFSQLLGNAINGLNNNVNAMEQGTAGLISGNNNDLGKAMVQMTEAQLSVQTAVQVRNKVLEAYNDIKNMQF
ncbi:flagellar hook-basal body complex protein FliE [Periweissella ghanensis]|uniref:Flagellar hook-basal body complex protein FliE n=1 Tax=Periweissella ghanensis TaxID=467997 RepID=A0ABM8ZAH5_9LACO|nr:flagellar hook-basal body complex protein FliE [Periweissella ghanensis]MCM0601038.1 flagellar hook-basal body complex protein FliE [Periweissella ghanensis]CAH0417881.1 Flagellar hook-basal body complex protein FliE [Periweissella ghanensis]